MSAPTDRTFHLWNWMDAPYHRQAFQHVRELVPTELIRNVDGPVTVLPPDPVDLDAVTFAAVDGSTTTWAAHLPATACDAVCVVHDGRIVHERYLNGMHERTPHLLMSVSKSFCGAALGIAIDRGHLAATDLVTDVAPELAGTSLDGATVQRVLNTATTNAVYAAAQQITDWGALLGPGDTLDIRIYQLSALVGRGASKTVTLTF